MRNARLVLVLCAMLAGGVVAALIEWSPRNDPGNLSLPVPLVIQSAGIDTEAQALDSLDNIELAAPVGRSLEVSATGPVPQELSYAGAFGAEARLARLQSLQSMHERLLQCQPGTELEWRTAFDMLIESMLVEKDRQQAFIDGKGVPFRISRTPGSFHTYNNGRQYTWTQDEYPIIASMMGDQAAQEGAGDGKSQIVELQLTHDQREAALSAYNAAIVALTEDQGNKK